MDYRAAMSENVAETDPSANTEQFRAFLHAPRPEPERRRTPLLVSLGVLGLLILIAVAWLVFGS
jgi:hypothetical protein